MTDIIDEFLILTFAIHGVDEELCSVDYYEQLKEHIKENKDRLKSKNKSLLETHFDVDLNFIGDVLEIPYELRMEAAYRITSGKRQRKLRGFKPKL